MMIHKNSMACVLLLLALTTFIAPSLAGEYGLAISVETPKPCYREIGYSLNTCHPDAVVEDMERFFVHGKEFRISAVRMGHFHGDIWLNGDEERRVFYKGLVSLLVRDDLKRADELISFMVRFPFRSMRAALEEEIKKGGHSKEAALRLKEVHRTVVMNYRD